MVYCFIPRPLIMIGSLRRVREQGRKPEDSRTTREKLGREGGRSTCIYTGVSAEDMPESPPSRPESPPCDHRSLRPRLRTPPKCSLEVHPESRAESTSESPPRPESPPVNHRRLQPKWWACVLELGLSPCIAPNLPFRTQSTPS